MLFEVKQIQRYYNQLLNYPTNIIDANVCENVWMFVTNSRKNNRLQNVQDNTLLI